MTLTRNKLYTILLIACLAGYIWLFYSTSANLAQQKSVEVCLIKHVTNIPCPSCGSTRSVISIVNGNFLGALALNPFGYLIAAVLVIAPIWISIDIISRKDTLFHVYKKFENSLKNPQYAIPVILLVIINWIWNITKGL